MDDIKNTNSDNIHDDRPTKASLHPSYAPATEDSLIRIRFVGNTAIPVGVDMHLITPFQLLAISAYLEHEAKKMLLRGEQEAMQKSNNSAIITPGDPRAGGRFNH